MRIIVTLLIAISSCTGALAQTSNDLFDVNVLQEIRLDVKPTDWQAIQDNPASDAYYLADLHWRNITVGKVGIRQRGGSTRSGIKPSLHVDINRYEDQTFLGLKSFNLKNNVQDASMMKDRLVMEVYSRFGVPVQRHVSAKLYVNGDYYGVYGLIETVDKTFLQRVFAENDGYLYSYELAGLYHFEYLGPDAALYSPRFFSPQTHENKPQPGPLVAMIRTMNLASDADFPTAIAPYLDISLFMKQLAIEDFMAEMDGILTGMNNFDLYRFLNGTSQVIPNDKDLSFGGPPSNLNRPQTPLLAGAARNVLIRRAFNVTAARNAYFNTIRSLSQITGTGGWLESEISRIYNQIRAAARDDTKKQCFTGTGTFTCTNANFEGEVTANLQFARQRGDWALNQIAALSAEQMYAFNARGGVSLTNASRLLSGYALVDSDIGSPAADGVAILTNRQNGILISETASRASATIQHGSIYVDAAGGVRTGLAIANAGTNDAIISFSFTAADGTTSGQGSIVVPARTQVAQFVDVRPGDFGPRKAVLTFDSSSPVFVGAFRALTNERSEFIASALPVIDSNISQGTILIPQFADGGGWTTQIVMINSSTQIMRGDLQFVDQETRAVTNSLSYSIAPQGYYSFQSAGTGLSTQSGFVRVVPLNSGNAPGTFAIFSARKSGITVTETVLPATAGSTSYRVYTENSPTVQTAIIIANPSVDPVTVTVEATTLSGASANLTGLLTIPGNGQILTLEGQIPGFEKIDASFEGVLRISTGTASGVAVGVFRVGVNERGDLVLSAFPPVDETATTLRTALAFPQFVTGGGFTTQVVLFSGRANTASWGVMRLFDQSGKPIPMQ